MKIVWMDEAWDDYLTLQASDAALFQKANALIKEIRRDPFRGTGKPEPLKTNMRGWWSRRINIEHRIVYRVIGSGSDQALEILQCRRHYDR